MIEINVIVKNGKVLDSFNHKNSTLSENALALRRLEEIKRSLLSVEYDDNFEVREENEP